MAEKRVSASGSPSSAAARCAPSSRASARPATAASAGWGARWRRPTPGSPPSRARVKIATAAAIAAAAASRHRDGPLRPRNGRRAGEARAVARHHGRLDPGAGARGRARRRRDVRHRAGDQGPDPPAEPGGLRRRTRGRGARPARALGVRAARAAARRAGRPHQPGDRRLRARGRARRGRRPALRRGGLDRHGAASTPRRCARRPRTCATSASWSPRPTPTASSAPTTRSPGSG